MRPLVLILLVFFSSVTYSQGSTKTFSCTPLNNYTIPFNITLQGNSLILDLRNKQHQLSYIEKYMDKQGYENYVFRNNLLEVITSELNTGVYTVSPHTKDQMITFGRCR